jgi:TetR/AcrR family transcriptional repressor of nem operon
MNGYRMARPRTFDESVRELAPTVLPIAALCRDALQACREGAAELIGARLLDHLPADNANKE